MILTDVDYYRVVEPLFEGARVILSYRGEKYSPEYIQGIAGSAFRIGGICPCAPTCTSAMSTAELIKLLGYECVEYPITGEGLNTEDRLTEMIALVQTNIQQNRPVLVWHAFTNYEWDVVCGYDEDAALFYGRGSYTSHNEYAKADQKRTANAAPNLGAIFIGENLEQFKARTAEIAALHEAVKHAHSLMNADTQTEDKWVFLEGLLCYDRWVHDFSKPTKERTAGDSYCQHIYSSTHRAAAGFLREIAHNHPQVTTQLSQAADHFQQEAIILANCQSLIGWQTAVGPDAVRNEQVSKLLSQAREQYKQGITQIEAALAHL